MVFESTSMRYETLVARFWLGVRGVPQSSCRRQSRDKRQELWGREWDKPGQMTTTSYNIHNCYIAGVFNSTVRPFNG